MLRLAIAATLVPLLAGDLRAQTATFDALTAGSEYAPGSQFSDGGLNFEVVRGTFGAGGSALGVQMINSFTYNPDFSGNFLNLGNNVGVTVVFPTAATEVAFDFYRGHPEAGLWINGSVLSFGEIPSTSIDGVLVTHVLGVKPPANTWGRITAAGEINSFAIVGTELLIDNLTAELAAGLIGDFNSDRSVDAADYVLWRKTDGTQFGFDTWRAYFGQSSGGGFLANLAVPESTAFALYALAIAGWSFRRRRHIQRPGIYSTVNTAH